MPDEKQTPLVYIFRGYNAREVVVSAFPADHPESETHSFTLVESNRNSSYEVQRNILGNVLQKAGIHVVSE